MQPLNANFPFEKAANLFDQYIDDGNSIEDLMLEINELIEVEPWLLQKIREVVDEVTRNEK